MVDNDNNPVQSALLIEQLKSYQHNLESVDITVSKGRHQGIIHVRDGEVLSAHIGILHGNGAILSIVQIQGAEINSVPTQSAVQKTVFITIDQIDRFLKTQRTTSHPAEDLDEEKLLEEAKSLFFRFHYKEAVDRLVAILRHNRFFYPAWLWQSRILTRQDYISRAIDEAYRWGNHDQDVWREARKMRPQLTTSDTQVKRCIFCWSILQAGSSCSHCKASFSISAMQPSKDLKQDEIRFALTCFDQAQRSDPRNSRTAFALALGHFNLKEHHKALGYLESAVQLSPKIPLYSKSLSLLRSIIKAEELRQQPVVSTPAVQTMPAELPVDSSTNPTILMVEDSMTSRKVLSMLLKRHNYTLLEAASGAEAIKAAASSRPCLVLLDVMLPDTNGHDLLAELRNFEHLREVPVIMLTGRHDVRDRLKGIQGGAQEYITKPFNPQKLTELVQSYVKSATEKQTVTQKKSTPPSPPISQKKTKTAATAVNRWATSPVKAPAPEAAKAPSEPPKAPPPGSKSIFIIEDSRTSRKVLAMLLSRNGYHLYEASSGQEALTLAPSIQPDLVLLDVMLPDMTGYTILPQLKQLPHFANLPFIMLTGNKKATDRLKGMLAGSNEYLTKPFDPQKLLSVISNYL
ncbi:Response regulator receiver domain-containing protein [Desulfopila aestuarii DSM 18488]|uniref:Response regulator receiver domain-containing protein n=2 Tax=Desulfopila aestuarii TaxID=231440 RepID=A0A1M7YCE9_9BACT|nr:Response regulator receiver domain-containing protein [Desulfopila aestuarii DSM 18488]